jgi:hypothetical protein
MITINLTINERNQIILSSEGTGKTITIDETHNVLNAKDVVELFKLEPESKYELHSDSVPESGEQIRTIFSIVKEVMESIVNQINHIQKESVMDSNSDKIDENTPE